MCIAVKYPFKIILASTSPRRKEILRQAGIKFVCVPSHIPEHPPIRGEDPSDYAIRLATEKAKSILFKAKENNVILAADTIVCVDGEVLGKPRSSREARRILEMLSGRTHLVVTGVAICDGKTQRIQCWSESTRVRFVRMHREEIQAYIRSGEPFDKAGAYAVQGKAGKFVERIDGCFYNVMGLPIASVYRRLNLLAASRIRSGVRSKRGLPGKQK
jgi:septum formation protein